MLKCNLEDFELDKSNEFDPSSQRVNASSLALGKPPPRNQTRAKARLFLEVSTGWASPSSRGPVGWRRSAALHRAAGNRSPLTRSPALTRSCPHQTAAAHCVERGCDPGSTGRAELRAREHSVGRAGGADRGQRVGDGRGVHRDGHQQQHVLAPGVNGRETGLSYPLSFRDFATGFIPPAARTLTAGSSLLLHADAAGDAQPPQRHRQ
jgi:hypothetical protein